MDDGTRSPPVQGKLLIARYLIHRIGRNSNGAGDRSLAFDEFAETLVSTWSDGPFLSIEIT